MTTKGWREWQSVKGMLRNRTEFEEAFREALEASHNRSSMEWQDWALETVRYGSVTGKADAMGPEWETAWYAEAQVYATLSVAAAIRESAT